MKITVSELKPTIDGSKGRRNKKAVVRVTGKTTNSKIPITRSTVGIAMGDLSRRSREMLQMALLTDYRNQGRHRIEKILYLSA